MGSFGDLFTSPREREGTKRYEDILREVEGMKSSLGDISTVGDVRGKFGLGGTSGLYGAAKRNLATRRGQALSSASARMGSRVANPEAIFSGIEGEFAGAFGDIEQQEAEAGLQDERIVAALLRDILGARDEYGMRKMGLKGGATADYLGSLSGASGFNDILALAGTVAKFV